MCHEHTSLSRSLVSGSLSDCEHTPTVGTSTESGGAADVMLLHDSTLLFSVIHSCLVCFACNSLPTGGHLHPKRSNYLAFDMPNTRITGAPILRPALTRLAVPISRSFCERSHVCRPPLTTCEMAHRPVSFSTCCVRVLSRDSRPPPKFAGPRANLDFEKNLATDRFQSNDSEA